MYSKKQLDYAAYMENNQCPLNDVMCTEAVWFTQNLLLGSKADMDYIFTAMQNIQKNAEQISKTVDK